MQGEKDCQRANGDGTDARAYAVVAVDELQQSSDLAFEPPFFVACTGAITDDASTQISEMRSQVPAELALWDIVSMSFGGNNVLFADLIIDCLDAKDLWGAVFDEGCSVSDERLRTRVEMLVGRVDPVPGEFEGEVTLPQLYDEVAGVVRPGGHVIVTGYPQLLEEPERWASWIERRSVSCQGLRKDDIRMLRGVTGYLNEQIGVAVLEATERWRASGITFHFVDLASSVYETSENNADRHGLCASDQWINGLTTGVTSGDLQHERSFHPTQAGHEATGRHLADLIRDEFVFDAPLAPPAPSFGLFANGVVPVSTCGWISELTGVQLTDGVAAGPDGEQMAIDERSVDIQDLNGDGLDDLVAMMTCYGGGSAIWQDIVVWLAGSPQFLVTETDLGVMEVVPDGWLHAIEDVSAQDSTISVTWSANTGSDPNCCPTLMVRTELRIAPNSESVIRLSLDQTAPGEVSADEMARLVEQLDKATTYAFAGIDLNSGTATVKEWVYQGESPEDWLVGDEIQLPLSDEFVYLRLINSAGDGTSSAVEFADWVNRSSGTDFPQVFWLSRDDGVVVAAAVAWDSGGTGECVEIAIPPLDENC